MVQALGPARCPACAMRTRLCICALIPRVECRTQLVLLVHRREAKKPTNTGTLAARCLAGSEVHVIGEQEKPVDYAAVCPADATNLFLFPGRNAVPLSRELCSGLGADAGRPIRLLVPDGNWGQAGRVGGKLAEDAPVTFVTLPEGPPTEYRLRRETRETPGGLATLEAIARALEILEGPDVSAPLLELFRIFVERTLWSRGKLPAGSVYGGVPPE